MHADKHRVLVVQPRNRPHSTPEDCKQSLYGRLLLQYLLFIRNQNEL